MKFFEIHGFLVLKISFIRLFFVKFETISTLLNNAEWLCKITVELGAADLTPKINDVSRQNFDSFLKHKASQFICKSYCLLCVFICHPYLRKIKKTPVLCALFRHMMNIYVKKTIYFSFLPKNTFLSKSLYWMFWKTF